VRYPRPFDEEISKVHPSASPEDKEEISPSLLVRQLLGHSLCCDTEARPNEGGVRRIGSFSISNGHALLQAWQEAKDGRRSGQKEKQEAETVRRIEAAGKCFC
jgi:hypothetical protein